MAQFHHLSICSQNEWISILVIFRQNTKAIALRFGLKMAHFHHLSICNQNEWIWLLVICRPQYQGYSLTFLSKTGSFSSLVNLQSKWMNFKFGHFSPNYQGYSLTFWPQMAHFHHFSICNQNEWISILVIFRQNTKAIALLFGQKWLIFITCQYAIKLNEFQFWSFFAKYQGYSLNFLAKSGSFSSLCQSAIKMNEFQFWSFFAKIPRL